MQLRHNGHEVFDITESRISKLIDEITAKIVDLFKDEPGTQSDPEKIRQRIVETLIIDHHFATGITKGPLSRRTQVDALFRKARGRKKTLAEFVDNFNWSYQLYPTDQFRGATLTYHLEITGIRPTENHAQTTTVNQVYYVHNGAFSYTEAGMQLLTERQHVPQSEKYREVSLLAQ